MSSLRLTDEELKVLTDLHLRTRDLMTQLGQLDVRHAALLDQVKALSAQAQQRMSEAATRLGIAPGTPWQMMPDGVVVVPEEPVAPAVSSPTIVL